MSEEKNDIKLTNCFKHIIDKYGHLMTKEQKKYFEHDSKELTKNPKEYIKNTIISIQKIGKSFYYDPLNDEDQGHRHLQDLTNIDYEYVKGNLYYNGHNVKNIPILAVIAFIRYNRRALIGTMFEKVLEFCLTTIPTSTLCKIRNETWGEEGETLDSVECIPIADSIKRDMSWDESSCSHIDSFLPFFPFKKIDDLELSIK